MNTKRNIAHWIRGWLPKEPPPKSHSATSQVTPELKIELKQKLFKNLIKAIAITDPIIGGVFFALNPLSIKWNFTTVWISTELVLILLAANVLIYLYLKHRALGNRV